MSKFMKVFIVIAVVLYFVSPVDFMPGIAIDDTIVIALGILAVNRLSKARA